MAALAAPQGMAFMPGGEFALPFRGDTAEVRMRVAPFYLDTRAVTQAEYGSFLRTHPGYRRSRIKRLFADKAYLGNWKDDATPPVRALNSPVTHVSWYAAKAYCSEAGKRLPTTAEWEWAAQTLPKGMDSAGFKDSILSWYARPTGDVPGGTGSGSENGYGIRDLFGLVWEWTSDFDAFGFTGFNQRGVGDSGAFCGSGSTRATKDADYATYMRWAFRLSLRPDYTVSSLGFRCARHRDEKGF